MAKTRCTYSQDRTAFGRFEFFFIIKTKGVKLIVSKMH